MTKAAAAFDLAKPPPPSDLSLGDINALRQYFGVIG